MPHFNTKLLVTVFAVIVFSSGDALILNTNEGVDSTLSRLQKAVSSSYQKFQTGELNYDLGRNFGDGVRIFMNVNDTIELPTIGVSPYFKIKCAVSRLTELFGPTTIWGSKLHGLSDITDDFNIRFINNEGDFNARLAVQIPRLHAHGEYMTNLTLVARHVPYTPDMYFLGNSSYNSSFSFLEFELEVEGRASAFENIFIRNVNLSFDLKTFDTKFSNLTLRSAARPGSGSNAEWFRQIVAFSEIPKYFKWDWATFHTTLDLPALANEIGRCLLQNIFSECTLMDLLVSAECMKLNIDEECLRTDILDVYFPLQPESNIKQHEGRVRRSCTYPICCIIPPTATFGVSTSDFGPVVQQVAANFGNLLVSGDGIFGPQSNNISRRQVHNRTGGPVLDLGLSLPDVEVEVRWRGINFLFGGFFRTWGTEVRGHQDGKENLSTEFLDENGTFVANYSVEFPVLYLSGSYDSDLTLYAPETLPRDEGEWSLIGAGEYNWTMKSVFMKVQVFGRAPMTENMSVSRVDFSVQIERLNGREGLQFTPLHNFIVSYDGILTNEKYPTYWREVIDYLRIEDFLFHDRHNERWFAFPEAVGEQLQCALDYAVSNCNILDLLVSRDCLRVDRNDDCSGDVMTVRQPTTWSTAMTSDPETEVTEPPTITTHLTTSTTVASTTVTTEAPDIPDNVDLLLSQTQILLDQAQFLLKIVQGKI